MSKLNSIESLMDGYNPQRQLLEQTRQLVKKWEPTGLLEGLEDETKVHGMAVLLENQAGQLIQEASITGGQNAEEWSGVALPLVRRIFGELAAQEFVSVQPMNLPSGLIFYLDFKYGTAQTDNHTNNADVFVYACNKNTLHSSFTVNEYSTYINYRLNNPQLKIINEYLNTNTNELTIKPSSLLHDNSKDYFLSINIYNCSSPIFNFISDSRNFS